MKLIRCDGRELTVRDVGEARVIFRLKARAGGPPIKYNGWRLVPEAEARGLLRELLDTMMYEVQK